MAAEHERRKFRRVPLDVGVQVIRRHTGTGEVHASKMRDISASGLRLVLPSGDEPGVTLSIEFELPDGGAPIVADGRIVWTETFRVGSEDACEAGVEFLDLDQATVDRINRCVLRSRGSGTP